MPSPLRKKWPAPGSGAIPLRPYKRQPQSTLGKIAPWISAPLFAFFLLVYGFYFALTAPYLIVQFTFPLAILGALAIWALPDSKRNPSGLVEGFFFAFFICLVMWPKYLALVLPGLPWITMVRLTGLPLVLILLISTSISQEFRSHMARVLSSAPLVWKILCVFLAIQVLTIPLSGHPVLTVNRVLNAQISWTAMFFAGCYVFSKPGRAERWIGLM